MKRTRFIACCILLLFFSLQSLAHSNELAEVSFTVFIGDFDATREAQIMLIGPEFPVTLQPGDDKEVIISPGDYQAYAMMIDPALGVNPAIVQLNLSAGEQVAIRVELQLLPGFSAPEIKPEGGDWPWPHSSHKIDWQPDEEADRLAKALLEATSVPRFIELLYEVLGRLGIGVYDGKGQVLLQGNEESLEDFYLYDFQLWIIARNFLEERYVPLENVVSFWGDLGVMANDQRLGPISLNARYLEQGLRSMRQWAEEYPKEPNGFLIRLIDGLGNREQYPFDLLEEMSEEDEEPPLDFAGMIERTIREDLQEEIEVLKQQGQIEEGDVFATEEGMDAMMSYMKAGDFRSLIDMFLEDDEDIDEIFSMAKEGLAEALQDPHLDASEREAVASSQETVRLAEEILLGGGDMQELSLDMIRSSLNTLRATRDGMRQRLLTSIDEGQQDIREMLDRVNQDDAQSKIDAAQRAMEYQMEVIELDHQLHTLEEQVEIAELNYGRYIEDTDEDDMFSGMPLDLPAEEKPSSDLALDALQALLLQIDFLFHPRTEPLLVAESSWKEYLPRLSGVAYASGGPGPDLYGHVRRGLDIVFGKVFDQFLSDFAPEAASRVASRLDVAGEVIDILHGLVVMSAHTVELKASYEPADATLEEGIRLLGRGEGRWDKWIQLEVTITFDPPEAMRAIEAGRMAGARFLSNTGFSVPLTPGDMISHSIAQKLANSELPEPGPQEGVLVKVNHSMDWYRLTRRDEKEWYDFAQWLLITDENGVAKAKLFVREDSEVSMTWGGLPKAAQNRNGAFLRVHPMTQVPDNMFLSVAEGVLGISDHMQGAFPGLGSAEARFHIEKLEPTMWVGNVTFTRKINADNDQSGRAATVDSRHKRAVGAGWLGEWTVTFQTEVLLDREGRLVSHGSSLPGTPPALHVKGTESGVIDSESYRFCDETDRKFEETESYSVETDFHLERDDSVRVSLQLHNWLDKYRVVVLPRIPSEALLMQGSKNHSEDVCIEQQFQPINHPPEQIRVTPRPEILQCLLVRESQYPNLSDPEHWKDYERDAYTLSGSAKWPSSPLGTYIAAGRPINFGPFRPRISVETHVSWNLRRYLPPDN